MQNESFKLRQLIGENIRGKRKRIGMTQEQFSGKAKLSVPSLSALENGMNFAKMETYSRIAYALDIPLHELFCAAPKTGDKAIMEICTKLLSDCTAIEQAAILNILMELQSLIHRN